MIVAQMFRGNRLALIALAATVAFAAGCARAPVPVPEFVKPYRMTIQQGNFVTRDMAEQLKPGMTKEQVRFILGTPLVTDIFHADRWDYTFYRDAPGGKRELRNFSVIFEDSKLTRVVGDLLPEPGAPAKPAPVKPAAATAPQPLAPAKEERGFFGRLFDRVTPAAPAAAEAPPEEKKQPQGQNWGAAEQPAPEPAKAEEKPEQKQEQAKPAAERGFFGRMLEKIGF